MFDTYQLGRPRTEYVTREVVEHRAPTDESVRLLKEMEQAAEAKRTAAMQMAGNTFNGVIEQFETFADDTVTLRAVFDLNGVRLSASVTEPRHEGAEDLLKKLHEKVAAKVATEVLVGITRGFKFPR